MNDLLPELQATLGQAYTLERELGGGGMSRVFVAQDHKLGRRVVVKVLPPSLAATVSVERFNREIMLAAGLQHPHIVPVLSAGEIAGLPYFIMPYIEGESLRARIMRGPLSVRETVNVMKDVARALAYAHDRNIVHRDIKPDNILLATSAAVVTDFGVAKALSASREQKGGTRAPAHTITAIGISLGTPTYMAPEQAAADPSADHRADIYALGVVAYEMLVGAPPFHGRSPQAVLAAHISESPPPLATRRYDVPVALADLITHCLAKEPANRPKSAAEIARTLDSPDVVSGAFAVPPRVARRRWRTWHTGAAAAVVLLAVASSAWWIGAGQSAGAPVGGGTAAPGTPATVSAGAPPPPRSVAVLPLASAGGDQSDAGAAVAMTSELTNALSNVPGLRVASQTAAGTVRERYQTLGDIGRALNVAMLLEGTMQRVGERVRVTVRLVSIANDSTLWADGFEGSSTDLFAVQDTVAKAVVAAVGARAGGQ